MNFVKELADKINNFDYSFREERYWEMGINDQDDVMEITFDLKDATKDELIEVKSLLTTGEWFYINDWAHILRTVPKQSIAAKLKSKSLKKAS